MTEYRERKCKICGKKYKLHCKKKSYKEYEFDYNTPCPNKKCQEMLKKIKGFQHTLDAYRYNKSTEDTKSTK